MQYSGGGISIPVGFKSQPAGNGILQPVSPSVAFAAADFGVVGCIDLVHLGVLHYDHVKPSLNGYDPKCSHVKAAFVDPFAVEITASSKTIRADRESV